MNHLKKLITPLILPTWWQDFSLALPRIICSLLLTLNFGAAKFGLPWSPAHSNLKFFEVAFWFPNDVKGYGGIFSVFPVFFAWMGAFSEAVGGFFLVLGFQTRIFSFLLTCTMLVVIFLQQFNQGIWNMLPGMGFLWVSIMGMVLGSGRFGVDYFIAKKWKHAKA
jgi:putative oxidoreductase